MPPMLPRERCDYLRDRRPAAAEAAEQRAARVLDHRQLRGLGHRPADGAAGAAGADRPGRCCPTCRTGAGTNTACGSAAGASSSCYERLGIRPTLAINARVCEDYPRVAAQAKKDGWEFMGHAHDQQARSTTSRDQSAMITRSLDVLETFTGTRPVGWLGPGSTQTCETPGPARRGRREIYRRLGVSTTSRSPITHHARTAGDAALYGRAQRHPDDDRAAPRERLSAQARDRSVRPALCRERASARRSWRWRSIPTFRGQPHRIKYLEAIYDYVKQLRRRAVLERRPDPRLVSRRRGLAHVPAKWVPSERTCPARQEIRARCRACSQAQQATM